MSSQYCWNRCNEPFISLATLAAIISSHTNQPLPAYSIFLGEVALTGQLTLNGNWQDRLKEAERCGFKQAFLGKMHQNKNNFKVGSLEAIFLGEVLKRFLIFITFCIKSRYV